MLKRIWNLLVIATITVGLLGGCGNSESTSSFDSLSPPTESTSSEPTPSVENEPITLLGGKNFSEGIAWVKYFDIHGIAQVGWLHEDGSIEQPFSTEIVTDWGSNFSGGYSYITTGGGASGIPYGFVILNSAGEITAQSPNDGNGYQILAGGDGIYLVRQSIRSMTENEDRYGILTGDGTWLCECAPCDVDGSHPLSAINVGDPNWVEMAEPSYLGGGIFCISYYSTNVTHSPLQTVLYNSSSKETYRLPNAEDRIYGQFFNGEIVISINDQLYIMSDDFDLSPISVNTIDTVIYNEGVIFTANAHFSGNRKTYMTDGKFYRTDGSVIADFTQYELLYEDTYDLYRYDENYASIIVCGADNSQYLGIVDLSGEFAFDPIKIENLSNWDNASTFSSGVIVCRVAGNGTQIVDSDGSQVSSDYFEGDQIENYVFNDGYCPIQTENGIIYLSTDGSVLEPHIKS